MTLTAYPSMLSLKNILDSIIANVQSCLPENQDCKLTLDLVDGEMVSNLMVPSHASAHEKMRATKSVQDIQPLVLDLKETLAEISQSILFHQGAPVSHSAGLHFFFENQKIYNIFYQQYCDNDSLSFNAFTKPCPMHIMLRNFDILMRHCHDSMSLSDIKSQYFDYFSRNGTPCELAIAKIINTRFSFDFRRNQDLSKSVKMAFQEADAILKASGDLYAPA